MIELTEGKFESIEDQADDEIADVEILEQKDSFFEIEKEAFLLKVNNIIQIFESGNKDELALSTMFEQLELLDDNSWQHSVDSLWDKQSISNIINIFESNIEDGSMLGQFYFAQIFTTHKKLADEKETVSDLFAITIIERLEDGIALSSGLENQLNLWVQNIQMVNSDIRMKLMVALLNNRDLVSNHLISETLSGIGFYGSAMVESIEDDIEKNADSLNTMLQDVTVLGYLKSKQGQAGYNEAAVVSYNALEKISEESNNYFIKQSARQSLKPLQYYESEDKVTLIKGSWAILMDPYYFYDIIVPVLGQGISNDISFDSLTTEQIESIYQLYLGFDPGAFYAQEYSELKDRYEDDKLRTGYNIVPRAARGYHKEKVVLDSCYSKISQDVGAIYNYDGVDSFFKLDSEVEQAILNHSIKFGTISEDNLNFLVNKFQNSIKSGDLDSFVYILQYRLEFSEDIQSQINKLFDSIDLDFLGNDLLIKNEFDKSIESKKDDILKVLDSSNINSISQIINSLKIQLGERRALAAKNNHGFSSEDTNLIGFFNQFNKRHFSRVGPTRHHTISYYLYLKKFLPEDIVSEFEQRFNIEIPESISSFDTYDDYLQADDHDIMQPFLAYPNFMEMSLWLNRKMQELSKSIQLSKKSVEQYSVSEIFEKEGIKKDVIGEVEYKRMVLSYKSLIHLPLRKVIEDDFDIKLNDLTLREQLQFLDKISNNKLGYDIDQIGGLIQSASSAAGRLARVRSFLSMESGGDVSMFSVINNISNKLDSESADLIFEKYGELVGLAQDIRGGLQGQMGLEVDSVVLDNISDSLLLRAKNLFIHFDDRLASMVDSSNLSGEVLNELENFKSNLLLAASVYKSASVNARASGLHINFENLEGVNFEITNFNEITDGGSLIDVVRTVYKQELLGGGIKYSRDLDLSAYIDDIDGSHGKIRDILQMIKVYRDSYSHDPEFQTVIIDGFLDRLQLGEESTSLYLLREHDDIVSFCRFDDLGDNKKYVGSFNVYHGMRGASIGSPFFNKIIELESGGGQNEIIADCIPNADISSYYIERAGFVGSSVVDGYAGTDNTLFTISHKSENSNYFYRSPGVTRSVLIGEYESKFSNNNYNIGDQRFILRLPINSDELKKITQQLVDEHDYVLTRYIFDRRRGQAYLAFELSEFANDGKSS